ncbi:hypothetical protein ACW0TN_00995, partial [Fusobacterium pseudoperiodonticum]
ENSAGSLYVENKGTIKGDVNLVGSNLVLGDNSIINGKLTTDSNELHSSYSLEEKKKGFSSNIEYALGNSKLVGTIFMKDGKPYLRYNLSDSFQDITGSKSKIGVEIEYGKPYDMLDPSKEIPLFDKKGMKK